MTARSAGACHTPVSTPRFLSHDAERKLDLAVPEGPGGQDAPGIRGRVEQGRSVGGLCYGYDVVKAVDGADDPVRGERTVNEAEAEIVRRVFRDFASGASPRAIARRHLPSGV